MQQIYSTIHTKLHKFNRLPSWTQRLILFFLLPALLYFVGFYILVPNTWGHFSLHFFLDSGDGLQNVWNIWWVNKSVTQLHQLPWHTNYLAWPHGVNLLPQTMNAFNGFLVIPFFYLFHFSLVQAVNTVVIFSFVMSGITMFWLAYYLTRSYQGAIMAGLFFTFSSYHFAHSIGHMQLISTEWIPLFLLAWWRLLDRPSYLVALAGAGSLALVVLCDYYYLFYAIIAAILIGIYRLVVYLKEKRHKEPNPTIEASTSLSFTKRFYGTMAVFTLTSAAAILPFVYGLWKLNRQDPLQGSHSPSMFSLDPFSPFIPGEHWYWYQLTEWFWHHLHGFNSETSVFLGISLITILIVAIVARRRLHLPAWLGAWWLILVIFWALALGPRLQTFGSVVLPNVPLLYAWLGKLFPLLAISGMPIRMFVMVTLASAVIAATVIAKLQLRRPFGIVAMALLSLIFFVDVRPRPMPLTAPFSLAYATVLKQLPISPQAGIVDYGAKDGPAALLAQTIHERPMAFGYLTRTPISTENKNFNIYAAIEQGRQDELCPTYHLRYMVAHKYYDNGLPIIYQDPNSDIHIYDLKNSDGC